MRFKLQKLIVWKGERKGITRNPSHTICRAGIPQPTGFRDGTRTPSIYLGAPGVRYEDCLKPEPRKTAIKNTSCETRTRRNEFDREEFITRELDCESDIEETWNNLNRHCKRDVRV